MRGGPSCACGQQRIQITDKQKHYCNGKIQWSLQELNGQSATWTNSSPSDINAARATFGVYVAWPKLWFKKRRCLPTDQTKRNETGRHRQPPTRTFVNGGALRQEEVSKSEWRRCAVSPRRMLLPPSATHVPPAPPPSLLIWLQTPTPPPRCAS
jgi:hypothetical protein